MNIYIQQIKQISYTNKYTKWYVNIVEKAIKRASSKKEAKKILGYCEKHHIIPQCIKLGGEKDSLNFCYLSAREHFLVHMMLPKMIKNINHSMRLGNAIGRMKNKKLKYYNSRTFETAKKINSTYNNMKLDEYKKVVSENMKTYYSSIEGINFITNKAETQKITMIGEGNPMFGKTSSFEGKSHSEEFISRMKNKTGKDNHRFGNPSYSKKYIITNQNGDIVVIRNLQQFCKENNIHYKKFYDSIRNNKRFEGFFGIEIKEPKAILIDPNKNKHEVYNIKEFCKSNNLYYQCIIHVIGGIKPQHKGWTGYKVNRE